MGTNYYFHTPKCPHCGRFDEPLHIGKSSCGWTFSFRGYKPERDGFDIQSLGAWLRFFRDTAGEIRDEYGTVHSADNIHAMVEEKRLAGRTHTDYCLGLPYRDGLENWKDDEGHSFSGYEFS